MPATVQRQPDAASQATRVFLENLFACNLPRDFAVRFHDGTVWGPSSNEPPRFTIVYHHPGAARLMFRPPTLVSFGEAYIFQDYDVEGDFDAFFSFLGAVADQPRNVWKKLTLWRQMRATPLGSRNELQSTAPNLHGEVHSLQRDRQAISYHYDLSNDFYSLWLDSRMVYTCAYFRKPDDSLDLAQEQKLDHICRKLRLRPGMKLLDIGCGWGGLILHAAQKYGVQATGVTLSQAQYDIAVERIRQAGVQDLCRVERRDYRELTEANHFDRIVSVGMAEAVGTRVLPAYFRQAYKLLKPGGQFLNHSIAWNAAFVPLSRLNFAKVYVFPDGELQSVHTLLKAAGEAGFEIRDVESLREHYTLTLRHWVRRLEDKQEEARKIVGQVMYRIWRFYMAGAAFMFESGRYNLYQTLLLKHNNEFSGLPLTRDDWYQS
jgi:cyclopropane-fatty-acyl-phospholipid synthase